MADGRHTVHLSDGEVVLIERALRFYHAVTGVQAAADLRYEADSTAHVASLIQLHLHCDCPANPLPPQAKKRFIPIEDRRTV